MRVHFNCYWEDRFLPLVDFGQLKDVAVELREGGVKLGGFLSEQGDQDG